MRHEVRLQLVWAVTFVVSGLAFALAFWFTPLIGELAALGFIMLYIGLSLSFLLVFRSVARLKEEFSEMVRFRRTDIERAKKSVERKYLKKKMDEQSYRRLVQDYEKQLTELESRIRNLRKI